MLQAVRRYPALLIAPMVLFAALGAALAIARKPNYTATAELSVGQLSVSDPNAIGSVLEASQQLAGVYSRAIRANSVQAYVGRTAGAAARGSHTSATPIPSSPLIKVDATSDSAAKAIAVANAASRGLQIYAQRSSQSSATAQLFARFHAASVQYSQLSDRAARLKRVANASPTAANRSAAANAEADAQGALLRRQALSASYQANAQTLRSTPVLQSFAVADYADSDRSHVAQIIVLLALLAGVAVGAALATLRLNRRVARLTRP